MMVKAHRETTILPTQSKGALYNSQLWGKCGFFQNTVYLSWQMEKCSA